MGVERDVGLGRAAHMARSAFASADAPALDPPPTTHAVFSKLLRGVGINNPSGEITAGDVFGDAPKNLYVYTYQQIFERPDQDALMEIAGAYGLTVVDARSVLLGSVAPLMRGKMNYTQDKAIADVTKIQKSYTEILRQRRMKYDLQLTVLPTEIFSNGNLDDSGFDLINDLNLIEEVLFIDKTKVYLNQQPFGPKSMSLKELTSGLKGSSGAAGVLGTSKASGPSGASGTSGSSGTSGTAASSGTSGGSAPASSIAAANTAKTYTLDDILKGSPPTGGELNYCASGSPLNKALDQYTKTSGTAGGTSDSGTGNGGGNTGTNTGVSTTGTSVAPDGTIVATAIENIDVANVIPPELATISVKSAGVFKPPTESFCNELGGTVLYTYRSKIGGTEHEIFCLSVDKKIRTYTSFSPTKSCIQCVVAGMNEDMKKLLSKNITPNKLTGNTYESTKCKSAIQLSDRLNMNIIMVPTPIITPNKYGTFVTGDMQNRLNAYVRNYLPYGNPKDSPPERIKDEVMANEGKGADQVNILDKINSQIAANSKAIADSQALQPIEQMTAAKNAAYQQTIKEMRQMTSYFKSFQDIFVRLSTNAKGICDKKDVNS